MKLSEAKSCFNQCDDLYQQIYHSSNHISNTKPLKSKAIDLPSSSSSVSRNKPSQPIQLKSKQFQAHQDHIQTQIKSILTTDILLDRAVRIVEIVLVIQKLLEAVPTDFLLDFFFVM